MEASFVCPRCGNSDPAFLGRKNGAPYCRRCIAFAGDEVQPSENKPKGVRLSLGYSLSAEQKKLSDRVVSNFENGINTLVYAVCGSGKTEISYGVIGSAMAKGMHVGFALPRRDVVVELYARLKKAFPSNSVVAVYGGHKEELTGDCIVLTTHQLYRYPNYFDLLVLDEIDAFPFKGDPTLIQFFHRAVRGHIVMMSATPSKDVIHEFKQPGHEILSLRTRYHKHPIPVPYTQLAIGPMKHWRLVRKLRQYRKEGKPCLVFVPSVSMAERLYGFLKWFVPRGNYVSSKKKDRPRVIHDFKCGKYAYLVTTAVLERGVTIRNLQVVVFGADNAIYDSAALIQIAGRAGRKADAPDGEVMFLASNESEGMKHAIKEIQYCNTFLQDVPSSHGAKLVI